MLENIKTVVVLFTIVVGLVIYAVGLYKKYKALGKEAVLADLRETAFALFLRAEERYGAKTGPKKMAFAVKQFYILVAPDVVEQYIKPDTVEKFLQGVFDSGYEKLKDYLDDGVVNGSIPPKEINPGGQITNTNKL